MGRNPWSLATNCDRDRDSRRQQPVGQPIGAAYAGQRSAQLRAPRNISASAVTSREGFATARAPKNVAMSLDGRTGVFTDLANNQVVLVDVTTGKIQRAIDVGKAPYGIELIRR